MVYGGKSWPLVRSMVLFQFRGCPVLGLICLSLDFDPFEPFSSGGGGEGGLFPTPLVLSFLPDFLDLLDFDLLLDLDPKNLVALELSKFSNVHHSRCCVCWAKTLADLILSPFRFMKL